MIVGGVLFDSENLPKGFPGAGKLRSKIRKSALYNDECFYCKRNFKHLSLEKVTRDHLFPESWGQTLTGNMVIACAGCNRGKGDTPPCRDIVVRFIRHWALHPYKTSFIGELYDEFHRAQALISFLEIIFGEPNIPGVIRS